MGELKQVGMLKFGEPPTGLARPLYGSEQEQRMVERQLALTATLRQVELDGATVVAYATQLKRLDPEKYTQGDVQRALNGIANEPRGEYETAFPSLGELRDRIEAERRKRTKQAAEAACKDRIASYADYADKLRQEREDEWERKKAAQKEKEKVNGSDNTDDVAICGLS
jgi:hypothetical protein